MKIKVKEIAKFLEGAVVGDENAEITGIADIKTAKEGDLTFLVDKKLFPLLKTAKASCVVVPEQIEKAPSTIIRCKNPVIAYIKIIEFVMPGRIPHPKGIHKTAVIGKDVILGKNVAIGANAVIEDNVKIGDNTVIYPLAYIGKASVIGNNCIVYSHVSIREDIKIGNRVIIHASSVIGADGFGYDNSTGKALKVPHIGDVIIEDDVEIGALTAIDRAKYASTKIGKGTKIDNLVQVAHNVIIGENCLFAAQSGISGSCTFGNNVMVGGQVGFKDHISIGDNVIITAKAGVTKSVPPKSIMLGSPARPIMEKKKSLILEGKLPEIYERLKNVEKRLQEKNETKNYQ